MRQLIGWGVLGAMLTATSIAGADGAPAKDAKEEAITRFKRGLALYQEGELRPALAEFRKAYALAPMYRVHFNIGQVCAELKDHACALTSFRSFLKEGGDAVPPLRRSQVEADLVELARRVGAVRIDVAEPGAEVTIDDVPAGVSPLGDPVLVSAGRRKITAHKPGSAAVTRVIEVAGAETITVRIPLAPAAPPAASATAPPARWSTLSTVGVGVAGALAAGAVITGALAPSSSGSRSVALGVTSGALGGTAVATLASTLIGTYVKAPAGAPRVGLALGPLWLGIHGEL